jgi:murein DD-endopeptidase MepM/ murein hydrolase activator NlpD
LRSQTARAATYTVVALVAFGALRYTTPLPEAPRPGTALVVRTPAVQAPPPAPVWTQRTDTIGRGESVVSVLGRLGLDPIHAARALLAAGEDDARRLPAGTTVTSRGLSSDSIPAEVSLRPAVDKIIHLRYVGGVWSSAVERLAWTTDTIAVRGAIRTSLYDALHAAVGDRLSSKTRSQLVWKLADIFEYRVDMSRDLQPNDEMRLLIERRVAPDGSPREGKILAARFTVGGNDVEAIRYKSRSASGEFFDQHGKSLRAAFLRAPLEFRRISSGFGMRNHPVQGRWKMHKGTDYAASSGTPVRAIGDGVVVFAGVKSGYGNTLEVRHRNGYVTRYGHLRGFARGVRKGTSVSIGKTVAYVGSTGMATGPHLHFEVLVGGTQRDPRVALRDKSGDPIPAREKGAFATLRGNLLAAIEGGAPTDSTRRLAVAD